MPTTAAHGGVFSGTLRYFPSIGHPLLPCAVCVLCESEGFVSVLCYCMMCDSECFVCVCVCARLVVVLYDV